jgi:hypothetical protein
MITSLERFAEINASCMDDIESERDYIRDTLEVLRATGEISNDAFLDAGTIQGGLSLLLNLLSLGIPDHEASGQLNNLKARAVALNEMYPNLDEKVESMRE